MKSLNSVYPILSKYFTICSSYKQQVQRTCDTVNPFLHSRHKIIPSFLPFLWQKIFNPFQSKKYEYIFCLHIFQKEFFFKNGVAPVLSKT